MLALNYLPFDEGSFSYSHLLNVDAKIKIKVFKGLKSFSSVEHKSCSEAWHHKLICVGHLVPKMRLLNCFSSSLSFRVSVKTFPTWLTHSIRYKCRWMSDSFVGFVIFHSQWFSFHFSQVLLFCIFVCFGSLP